MITLYMTDGTKYSYKTENEIKQFNEISKRIESGTGCFEYGNTKGITRIPYRHIVRVTIGK